MFWKLIIVMSLYGRPQGSELVETRLTKEQCEKKAAQANMFIRDAFTPPVEYEYKCVRM